MALVLSGDGTVTGLAVGGLPDGTVDEGTLATDSVTTTKIPAALENTFVSGRKNLIINGDFSVNQRGTAATTGGTYLTADRFKAGATNVTFQTVANDRDLSISNMLKVTSHTNGYGVIVQPIEDVHTASGKNITLSFWAKTSDFSSFRLEMSQNFGSGGSTAVEILNNTSYWSVPDSNWNQYTATIAIPSISGKTIGTGSHLNIVFGSNSGTSGGIAYYSEVQVELGSVATDFEHRGYGEELALCQRYFEKLGNPDNSSGSVFFGITSATNATSARGPRIDFKVTKRATPTMALTGSLYYLSGPSWQSIAGFGANTQCIFPHQTTTSGVAGTAYTLATSSGSGNYITADAEL